MSSRRSTTLTALLLAASLLSCSRQPTAGDTRGAAGDTSAAPPPAGAATNSPGADVRVLSEPTAFELVSSAGGALLGWISAQPPALHVARFDAPGAPAGTIHWQLSSSAASDLALADTGAGAGAIWRERAGTGSVARGVWLGPDGTTRALDLGAAWGDAAAGRGNLALVSRGTGALALVRGPRVSCEDGSQDDCFGFRFYALSPEGASETGLGLRVPVPCDARAAQLVAPLPAKSAQQRWHYAVCTRSERAPVLTVFSIEPDRSYASAREIFAGCSPLGAGYFAGQPAFVAECRGQRQLARVPGADAPFELENLDVRGLVCGPNGARVRLGNGWLALDQPLDHLELLLDSSLTPPGSRAAWTGSALLVARAEGRLALDRYACEGNQLHQLSSPLE